MKTGKVKFAIAGSGHIGKRHAEMIRRNPEAELVAMCDILTKEEIGLNDLEVPFFSSIEDLLSSGLDFDVVTVATPNGLHAEHSLKALRAGKHVVCEKPMALSKKDCEAVIDTASQMNLNVFPVMQNRYSPPAVWIKEIISKNLLGKIFLVQLNCYWNRDDRYYLPANKKHSWKGSARLDGGTLFTQFSHFVDILYWLFGDIKDIEAKFNNFTHQSSIEFEDSGLVNFNFVKGGMGSINYSTAIWDVNLESSLTIIGERGSVKIGGQYMNEVVYSHIKDYSMPELDPVSPANDYGHYKGSAANHHFVIENVVNTLKGRTKNNTDPVEGLKVVEIIERIYSLKIN